MSEALAKKLSMGHLEDATNAQLREAISGKEESPEDSPDADPRSREEYTFSFSFTDRRKRLWSGDFTTKILDLEERRKKSVLYASLAEGMPFESLPPYDRVVLDAIAHMTFSLIKTPKWAEKLRRLQDPDLLLAIYEEVNGHEATFLGREQAPAGGEAKA